MGHLARKVARADEMLYDVSAERRGMHGAFRAEDFGFAFLKFFVSQKGRSFVERVLGIVCKSDLPVVQWQIEGRDTIDKEEEKRLKIVQLRALVYEKPWEALKIDKS